MLLARSRTKEALRGGAECEFASHDAFDPSPPGPIILSTWINGSHASQDLSHTVKLPRNQSKNQLLSTAGAKPLSNVLRTAQAACDGALPLVRGKYVDELTVLV